MTYRDLEQNEAEAVRESNTAKGLQVKAGVSHMMHDVTKRKLQLMQIPLVPRACRESPLIRSRTAPVLAEMIQAESVPGRCPRPCREGRWCCHRWGCLPQFLCHQGALHHPHASQAVGKPTQFSSSHCPLNIHSDCRSEDLMTP